jgi:hypothetical protein
MDIINLMPNEFQKQQAILMFKQFNTKTILKDITISNK